MSKRHESNAPRAIVNASVIDGLTDLEALILFIELLFPGGNIVAFLRNLAALLNSQAALTAEQVDKACAHLVSRGYMTLVLRKTTASYREYKAHVLYDSLAIPALFERVRTQRAALSLDAITRAYRTSVKYACGDTFNDYDHPKTACRRAWAILTLLGFPRETLSDDEFISADAAFDGASYLAGSLTEDFHFQTGALTGAITIQLVPAAMSAFFFYGRDVGDMLEAVRECATHNDTQFPAMAILSYAALRIWRGEAAELDGIEAWIVDEEVLRVRGLENAFKCVALGEWNAASTTFSSFVAMRLFSDGNPILFPFLALAYAVGRRADMPEAKRRKICRIMDRAVPPPATDDRWGHDPVRRNLVDWAEARLAPYGRDNLTHCTRSLQSALGAIPLCFALHSPLLVSASSERESAEHVCTDHLLHQADKALAARYPLMGSLFLAGYARFGDRENPEYVRALDLVTKSRVRGILSPCDHLPEWKILVSGLSNLVGNESSQCASAAVKEKKGVITWGLRFDCDVAKDGFFGVPCAVECNEIVPCYRAPRAAADGSEDKRKTTNGVLDKAFQNLLTEQDRRILDEMLRSRYNNLRDRKVPNSILEVLADHPYVIETFWDNHYYLGEYARSFRAISFTRLTWHVSSVKTDDGGLSLSLPLYLANALKEPCLIRLGVTDFRFLKLNARERDFVAGFFDLAPDGVLRLPAQALEEASPVLAAMAKLVPMEGNFSAIADTSGLERIPGDPVPTVRLAFQSGTLEATLCVKPYAKNAALVFKPGAGAPERMVRDGKTTQVLVRDLAAERAAVKKVADALADFSTWGEPENGWKIDDLIDDLSFLATLKDLGDGVRMEWREGDRLNVLTKISNKGRLTAKGGADRWFRVDGTFQIDEDLTCSLLEILKAFRGRIGRFIPLGEKGYARISSALLKRLEALEAAGRERKGALAVAPAALPMLEGAFAKGTGELALPREMAVEADRVRAALAARHAVPERLKATLRAYQTEGYTWLARLAECGFGACLADDMGLGKTVQLIALLLARAKDGASLVVAPTSVGGNWRREIERFAPTLTCHCAWETPDDVWQKAEAHDVVITSYGMLVAREEKFLAREWNGVVLDEAQAIKNETTERARVVKKLVARFRVAATGTPIENRLTELWSIFDFLNPGMLGTSNEFIAKFTHEGHATPALKNLVRPLILRRLKREVLDDLPEKTEITLTVPLDESERAGYEACRRKALETLAEGGGDNRISILAELTRLRRYCCHPSLVMPTMTESAKMESLVELLRDLKGANHRVLVFSQFTDYLALVQQRLQAEGISFQYLDGTTSPKERERRVADFQKGEGDVFLMSLKAGGTGLNLTAANYVVLLDPWWNPAVEDQAADRVHRIGQKQPVTVYRLIAADTVEERVLELHAEKKQLATDVLDGTASSALTPEALMKLFG